MKSLSAAQVAWWTLAGTAAIELLTVSLRFGFGLESSVCTAPTVGLLTGGVRIHHGYLGLLLLVAGLALRRANGPVAQRLRIIGCSLFFSDLLHHFVVLWWAVGDPEFRLTYP